MFEWFSSQNATTQNLLICVLFGGSTLFGCFVCGVMLRGGVRFFNWLNRAKVAADRVPMPGLAKATGVALVVNGAHVAIFLLFLIVFKSALMAIFVMDMFLSEHLQLLPYPIGVLFSTWLVSRALPTSFVRAFLVLLCQGALTLLFLGLLLGCALFFKHFAS